MDNASPTKRPRLLLADDHRLVLDGLESLLCEHYEIISRVSDGHALVDEACRLVPDAIVSDVSMPNQDGLSAARKILESIPTMHIVMVTMSDEPALASEALNAGIGGYVLKSEASRELFDALETVLGGRTYVSPALSRASSSDLASGRSAISASNLTERQVEVLRCLGKGCTMKEVAHTLHISPRTVAFHKYRIMEQLGIHTNAELIRYALSIDLVVS